MFAWAPCVCENHCGLGEYPSQLLASPEDFEQLERVLRERLDALGPAPRAELLHVLMLPDFDGADRLGEF